MQQLADRKLALKNYLLSKGVCLSLKVQKALINYCQAKIKNPYEWINLFFTIIILSLMKSTSNYTYWTYQNNHFH